MARRDAQDAEAPAGFASMSSVLIIQVGYLAVMIGFALYEWSNWDVLAAFSIAMGIGWLVETVFLAWALAGKRSSFN
jgi:hypothetical protein